MERVILHCDADAFFASVEAALHPEYRNVPFAVCGDPKKRHGIVLAKNAQAKACGIQTGQTLWQAQRLCPDLQWCLPHHEEYEHFYHQLNELYLSYTDRVEPYSIDESFLDVTGSERLFGDGTAIARQIQSRVWQELGITVSIGVSFCKVFAKLGSDLQKPNGITVLTRENYQQLLYALPISRMLFVGDGTRRILQTMHIQTIGDLAHSSRALLCGRLGKAGEQLHDYANAKDFSEVTPWGQRQEVKSVSRGMTYEQDLVRDEDVGAALWFLCDRIGTKLRRLGKCASCVCLTIKDANFRVVRRQMQMAQSSDSSKLLFEAALSLYHSLWKNGIPIRSLTVSAAGLCAQQEQVSQLSFLPDTQTAQLEKYHKMEQAVDAIRNRYGWESVDSAVRLEQSAYCQQDTAQKESFSQEEP